MAEATQNAKAAETATGNAAALMQRPGFESTRAWKGNKWKNKANVGGFC